MAGRGPGGPACAIKGPEILASLHVRCGFRRGPEASSLGEPHLIHPIRTEEPYLRIRGINYPWLNSLSH